MYMQNPISWNHCRSLHRCTPRLESVKYTGVLVLKCYIPPSYMLEKSCIERSTYFVTVRRNSLSFLCFVMLLNICETKYKTQHMGICLNNENELTHLLTLDNCIYNYIEVQKGLNQYS